MVNFEKKFEKIKDLNSIKVIAQMNDYYFKLDKMQREFIWHQHPETDEVFMVIDGNLTITFSDTGVGMNQATLDRIFDPSFTTRRGTGGTGIGLSVVERIIESYHGSISVRSTVGQGTTFTLKFPTA